jgi:hypothetical protein
MQVVTSEGSLRAKAKVSHRACARSSGKLTSKEPRVELSDLAGEEAPGETVGALESSATEVGRSIVLGLTLASGDELVLVGEKVGFEGVEGGHEREAGL